MSETSNKATRALEAIGGSTTQFATAMIGGQLFGLLYLGNDRIASLFDQRSLELLTVFASHAALVVKTVPHAFVGSHASARAFARRRL